MQQPDPPKREPFDLRRFAVAEESKPAYARSSSIWRRFQSPNVIDLVRVRYERAAQNDVEGSKRLDPE
jgi:hypothetical protein